MGKKCWLHEKVTRMYSIYLRFINLLINSSKINNNLLINNLLIKLINFFDQIITYIMYKYIFQCNNFIVYFIEKKKITRNYFNLFMKR